MKALTKTLEWSIVIMSCWYLKRNNCANKPIPNRWTNNKDKYCKKIVPHELAKREVYSSLQGTPLCFCMSYFFIKDSLDTMIG